MYSPQAASTVIVVSQPAGSAGVGSNLPSGPGAVVTVVGGPNVTAAIPGPQSDAIDLFGIIPVFLAIGAAIVGARWLFGRTGGRPLDAESREAASGPRSTEREEPL
jgi:hypothetical protein